MIETLFVILMTLWFSSMLLILTIVFHELGHFIMAKALKLHPCLIWTGGNPHVIYFTNDHKKKRQVLLCGMITGLLPALTIHLLIQSKIAFMIFLIGYACLCNLDLAAYVETYRNDYKLESVNKKKK